VPTVCSARYSSAIWCLRSPRLTVDDRDPARLGRGPHPAGEPPRHPHQVRVVQLVLEAIVQSPPHPESARRVAQRVVGVEHDAIHAVIAAEQKIAVPLTERSARWVAQRRRLRLWSPDSQRVATVRRRRPGVPAGAGAQEAAGTIWRAHRLGVRGGASLGSRGS
jgi:hypothetical protein